MKTYYIKQKISLSDKYYVYDANNEPYLEIISNNKLLTIIDRLLGSIFTFGNKLTIKKKVRFLKNEYDLYNKENKIASLKQHIISIKPKISIIANNDNYLINGDLMARSFTISKNNIDVAQINKSMFNFKDSYKIDIFEEKDELICLSLLIAIDNSINN